MHTDTDPTIELFVPTSSNRYFFSKYTYSQAQQRTSKSNFHSERYKNACACSILYNIHTYIYLQNHNTFSRDLTSVMPWIAIRAQRNVVVIVRLLVARHALRIVERARTLEKEIYFSGSIAFIVYWCFSCEYSSAGLHSCKYYCRLAVVHLRLQHRKLTFTPNL